jgi:hypothetical protein
MTDMSKETILARRAHAIELAKGDLIDEVEALETALRDLAIAEHSVVTAGLSALELRRLHGIATRKLLDARDMLKRLHGSDAYELASRMPVEVPETLQ